MARATLGVRLNNPGNIEHGQPWYGLHAQQVHKRFCRFVTPEYGIRAIHKIIQTYVSKYGFDTIEEIINRWAPPFENNSKSYIKHVDDIVTVADYDDILDVMDPTTAYQLVSGIIAHENANYKYPEGVVWTGLKMAGVPIPASPNRHGNTDAG